MPPNPRIPGAAGRRPIRWILAFSLTLGLLSLTQPGCYFWCSRYDTPEQCGSIFTGAYIPGEARCAPEGTPLPCPYCQRYESNGSFEGETNGHARGWLGDSTRVVPEEQGVTPCAWLKMLRVEATTPEGPGPDADALVYQVIDLRDQDFPVPGRIVASMLVNRVPNSPDSEFRLTLEAYEGDPAIYPSALNRQIGFQSESFIVDNDPTTWRYLGTELVLPVRPDFIVVVLHAAENVFNNVGEAEFEGHYIDGVQVQIGPTQPFDLQLAVSTPRPEATVGEDVDFTITLVNDGPATATDIVVAVDHAPEELAYVLHGGAGTYDPATRQWTLPSLPSGATTGIIIRTNVQSEPLITTTFGAALRSTTGTDLNPSNNQDEVSLVVAPNFDVQIEVTADQTTVNQGDMVTFSLRFSNNGPAIARSRPEDPSLFYVRDPLPPGFDFEPRNGLGSARVDRGTLDRYGESDHSVSTFGDRWFLHVPVYPDPDSSYTMQLTAMAAGTGTLTGYPQISGRTSDGDNSLYFSPFDDFANNTDSVTVEVLPSNEPYDLELVIDTTYYSACCAMYVVLQVRNHGPGIASNVVVSDPVPAGLILDLASGGGSSSGPGGWQTTYDPATGLWHIPFIRPGDEQQISHTYIIQPGTFTKTTSIIGSTYPGDDPANNTVTATWSVPLVTNTYDLEIAQSIIPLALLYSANAPKTAQALAPTVVGVGESIAIRLTVTNHGPHAVNDVRLGNSLFPWGNSPFFREVVYPDDRIRRLDPGQTVMQTRIAEALLPGTYVNTAYFDGGTLGDTDATNNAATDTVVVVVNEPPVAVADAGTTTENTPVVLAVLDNDTDPNGNISPSTVTVSNPTTNGTATSNLDGTITYTPNPGFIGTDSFDYTVRDFTGLTSNTAPVTVTVQAATNTPPVAVSDVFHARPDEDTILAVLSNDYDPDGDTFTLNTIGQPSFGTLQVTNNGQLRYNSSGFTGTESFGYSIIDEHGARSPETEVFVNVNNNPDYDLAVATTVSPDTVTLGLPATFTVTVTNNGPSAATGVEVAMRIPPTIFAIINTQASQGAFATGRWSVGALPSGQSATLTITGTPQQDPPRDFHFTLRARLDRGLGGGDDPANNIAEATLVVNH